MPTTSKTTARKPAARPAAKAEAPVHGPMAAMYASIGAGQVALEKARELSGRVAESALSARTHREEFRKSAFKAYGDLVHRGETLVGEIREAGYTKAAVSQTKTARRQVKAAATSVRKAVDAATEAARTAAHRVA